MDEFRTIITEATVSKPARAVCADVPEAGGDNMLIMGLSASGKPPPTHYISTGYVPPTLSDVLPLKKYEQQEKKEEKAGDSKKAFDLATAKVASKPKDQDGQDAKMQFTERECDEVFAKSDVSDQEPFIAMERMGLKLIADNTQEEQKEIK